MADVSLGDGSPLSLGYGESLGPLDGEVKGDVAGAVGVGTGGKPHAHSPFVGFVVRIGLAFLATVGSAGSGATAGAVVGPGTASAAFGRVVPGRVIVAGPPPIPAFGVKVEVTAGPGGNVSAAAGVWASIRTTPR
ncbi:hypothetical protein [Paractinoplanes globisporus]|uniref:hypothetical protein n=1 Tax=Paractinoplanes globisporus TaxID=113565 RepID=UPI000361A3A2|nr:hypothetical protein [Actinoplanes globisporus]